MGETLIPCAQYIAERCLMTEEDAARLLAVNPVFPVDSIIMLSHDGLSVDQIADLMEGGPHEITITYNGEVLPSYASPRPCTPPRPSPNDGEGIF